MVNKEVKSVYICSPYKAKTDWEVKMNIRKAVLWGKTAYKLGYLPICVHIYLEKITGLREGNGDREELLRLGKDFVKMCDELWICQEELSDGMKDEIRIAKEEGIKIRKIYKELIK